MIDNHEYNIVVHQKGDPEQVAPEGPLFVKSYHDVFSISQFQDQGRDEMDELIINYETVPELIKVLRAVKPPEKKK